MLSNIGSIRIGWQLTRIEIYVDLMPSLIPPQPWDKKTVVFIKYGNIPLFMTGSGFGLHQSYSVRMSNGVFAVASYPVHHDLLQISFHNTHPDNPPFYLRTFNLG